MLLVSALIRLRYVAAWWVLPEGISDGELFRGTVHSISTKGGIAPCCRERVWHHSYDSGEHPDFLTLV